MHRVIFCLLFLLSSIIWGQSEQLAKNYLQQGEYEKALSIYKQLYQQNSSRITYVLGLVESHQQLEQFDAAEKLIRTTIARSQNPSQLYVELGHHFEMQHRIEEANKLYDQALDVSNYQNINRVYTLAQTFEKYSLLNRAAITYEKGMAANPGANFNIQLAKIYGEQGQLEKMFNSYLTLIQLQPNYRNIVRRNFSAYITEDSTNEANQVFRKLLIKKLQQNPDIIYNEMLSWLFVQQKEFKKAFAQEKAIFKRKDEGLQGIIDLARIAIAEKDIKSATTILDYILDNPAASSDLKLTAHKIILKSKIDGATTSEYNDIDKQYTSVFETYGKGRETIGLQIDYAHFMAFYQDEKVKAFKFLKDLLETERLSRFQTSRIKMEMADILILDQKFNQALIYYTQVQNALKNNFLAQDARFKVAQTSYYKGDFKWAQTQLDVLKSSTSQLIANDAMELSLIISDNSLEDSTQTALKIFAKADLLRYQNKTEAAIAMYEKILTDHKGEKIEDEAFMRQAQLFEKTSQYDKAKTNYLKIIEFYGDDILADDALYALANLYVEVYNEPDKAKELYEKLIFNHADSIFFVDARKKYRELRGDAIK
ncbi:tetratricopeptide repeat protein [Aquimarina intermedia]|uniref:Tetratricopeptide repeat protein n=1 Tax=Aquimarina intermedia TaxID=350814 RepID=A0A5S5C9R4_9FLAO|nr:tetratricopeptide repeat protein [Aquimarina intermedia]TYP76145.1 tetratricopeptide repeat protein [Aquimarina intermedia]